MQLPELIVFDLDQCLWTPEMYTLSKLPTKDRVKLGNLGGHGAGVVGVYSGGELIQLFPDALEILQDIYLEKYPGVRIAAASSADTPQAVKIGKTAMGILEILPGVTMRDVFAKNWDEGFDGNIQIGRTPPLSSDKASTHFPILRRLTGIDYDKMIFFDDCLWGDHCGRVEAMCPGVIAVRTPDGLQHRSWKEALQRFAARAASRNEP
jgi:magnesium-dependent phosphatase 1